MVDFIKIHIKDTSSKVFDDNNLLSFFDIVNLKSGEVKNKKTAYYKGLKFVICDSGFMTIEGSLHKYWNDGIHNYNDFNQGNFFNVLDELKNLFKIDLSNCILRQLEIGVNIIPPIQTNEILKYCFLHKTKPFEYIKNSDEGKYKQVEHSQYYIKIYNKRLHYQSKGHNIGYEILRIEVKYSKMEKVNKIGIYSLQDLKNLGLNKFKDILLNEWLNVLYFDTTIKVKEKIYLKYSNPIYWQELVKNNYDTFDDNRKKLKILNSKSELNTYQTIYNLIEQKSDEMAKNPYFDTLYIMSNPIIGQIGHLKKVCTITGVDISMQKDNSNLLSINGLRYLYKNDPNTFLMCEKQFLTSNWKTSPLDVQISEIAHNIRNKFYNRKYKNKRIYKPHQINLLSYFG